MRSTYIPGENYESVSLKCANLRIAFLAFDLLFIMFTLIFLGLVARYSDIATFAEPAKRLGEFFAQPKAFMIGPIIVFGTIMYFAFARKTVTWYNGLRINDVPVEVESYHIKEFSARYTFIYIKTADKLWVLNPVTSQENRKFPNIDIMNKELARNQAQVELLKEKLASSGVKEQYVRFFTTDVIILFLLFILLIASIFIAGLIK